MTFDEIADDHLAATRGRLTVLELRPNCEACDRDLPPGSAGRPDLLLRVHVLRRLRRDPAAERVPELRRRVRAAPGPAGDRAPAGRVAGARSAVDERRRMRWARAEVAAFAAAARDIPPAER